MSIFKNFYEMIFGFKVKVDKNIYLKLVEESENNPCRRTVDQIVNKVLYERYKNIEIQIKNEEEEAKKDKELISYYEDLDKYLFSTLNGNVEIGITNDLKGYDEKEYKLLDYSLSKVYKKLSLKLERNGEYFPISFNEIRDIKFTGCGDNRVKVWIYMPKDTWRFYLTYKNDIIEKCEDDFKSGKLELVKEIPEYEKLKNVDNLKYHLEQKKYNRNDFESEKLVRVKNEKDIYLINFLDSERNVFFGGRGGDIYFVSKFGDEGKLFYSINSSFNKESEEYIKIIDILPERYNLGIGTEALKYLEEIAVKHGIKRIVGELSFVDLSTHEERLIHFYKKNGYTINGHDISKNI